MDGGVLQQGVYVLENLGVVDVILPFILVFVIVFAVLQKTKILGENKEGKPMKNFNSVIALVMGLAVVIPHVMGSYPDPNMDIVNIINIALPNISIVLIAVIMLLLIIGVFGGGVNIAGSSLASWAVIFAIAATVFIFGSAANWFQLPMWLDFLYDSDTQALVIIVLIFAVIMWFITKEDKPKNADKPSSWEKLGKDIMSIGKKD